MNSFLLPPPAVLVTRILDSKNATQPLIQMTSFKPPYSFEKQGKKLERCTPEAEGIPSGLIEKFLNQLRADDTLNMHDILILRNGKILCEAGFGAQRTDVWKYTFSACKSVTSLAVGMLIDDGILSLDEKILDIFPKEPGPIARIKLKDLCVDDLLTMRATILFSEAESMTTTDWIKDYLNFATKGEIGKTFKYNSLNTYLLSAIVTKKTGLKLSEFLDKRLFKPLGIVNYYWEKSPQDIDKGGWGLYILPEDFAKIGYMVMCDGVYEGQQIVSREYIQMATAKQVDVQEESASFDYGYQIWVGKKTDTFLFNGMLGQNVIGFRRNGLVVVSNAGNGEFFQQSNYFHYLLEAFDRDFEKELPQDIKSNRKLKETVDALSLYTVHTPKSTFWSKLFNKPKKTPDLFDSVTGEYRYAGGDKNAVGVMPLILQAVQNEYTKGFDKMILQKKDGIPYLSYYENGTTYAFALGFDCPTIESCSFGKNNFLIACSAKFRHNEDDRLVLIVRLDFLETPCSRVLKIVFDGRGNAIIRHTEIPGEDFVADATSDMLKQISEIPLPFISGMIDRFGEDYTELKLHKAFSPEIKVSKV